MAESGKTQATVVVLASLVLAVLVVQVAVAGGGVGGATTSASVSTQVKKLKKRVAALEAKPDQVGQVPTSLPPSGPASGDLTGSYPNPTLGVLPAVRATAPGNFNPIDCGSAFFILNSTNVAVLWLSEAFDTAAMHAATTCASLDETATRLTAPRAGLYEVDAGIQFGFTGGGGEDDGVGERFVGLRVNGSNYVAGSRIKAVSGNGAAQTVSTLVALNPSDYVEVVVFQDSGGEGFVGLNAADNRNFFAMRWVGPAS